MVGKIKYGFVVELSSGVGIGIKVCWLKNYFFVFL